VRGVIVAALLLGALVGAAPALAQAPPPPVIADGVTVHGLPVGSLTAAEAKVVLQDFARRPFTIAFRRRSWTTTAWRVGSRTQVGKAVDAALVAPAGTAVPLRVTVDIDQLRHFVARLESRFSKSATDSRVVLRNLHPRLTRARRGIDVIQWETRMLLRHEIKSFARGPVRVQFRFVAPSVTPRNFKPVIVIRRGSHLLYFYRGSQMRFRARFGIAVGQPIYPTPLGKFSIVTMQRNPWWYPPDSSWAAGASPSPPGPGNPLGTRWMGLSAAGVGIHGTPDAASIGYSASHGCIRMRIPDAEWLFNRVEVGSTVFIVGA
jgi:lipoprotein-anchoring transpeptidase ErfK/SrfK